MGEKAHCLMQNVRGAKIIDLLNGERDIEVRLHRMM
jgi:hypothetical protein